MGDAHDVGRTWDDSSQSEGPPPLPARTALRRIVAALACVAILAALIAGLHWSARDSLYRGSLSSLGSGVEVTRGGTTAEVKTLQIIELRAGDLVRVSSTGEARLSWAAGGTAELRGGAAIAITEGLRGLRLDAGRVVLRCDTVTVELECNGKRYGVRGAEIRASPEEIEATRGDTEILTANGSRLILRQGEARSWP